MTENYIVPGLLDQAGRPTNFADTSIHGTAVAAMAGGKSLGVAKNANLIGVKIMSSSHKMNPEDIVNGWNWAVADVKARNRQGKAVINLSSSK